MSYDISIDIASVTLLVVFDVLNRLFSDRTMGGNKVYPIELRILALSGLLEILRYLGDALNYSYNTRMIIETLAPIALINSVFMYLYMTGRRTRILRSKIYIGNFLLADLMILLYIVNIPTGMLFRIEDGVCKKTMACQLNYVVFLLCLMETLAIIIWRREVLRKREMILMISAVIIPMICFGIILVYPELHIEILGMTIGMLVFCFALETPNVEMLKEAAAKLEQSRESEAENRKKAEAANLVKTNFLESVSKELLEPIHEVIDAGDEILQENTEQEIKEHATQIREAGEQLLRLVDTLLDFSKRGKEKEKL